MIDIGGMGMVSWADAVRPLAGMLWVLAGVASAAVLDCLARRWGRA